MRKLIHKRDPPPAGNAAADHRHGRFVADLHEEKIEVGTEATGLYNPNHAYGSPDDAKGYVQRLVDAGADEIMFIIQMGTVPQWAAMETIENLCKLVIPDFR